MEVSDFLVNPIENLASSDTGEEVDSRCTKEIELDPRNWKAYYLLGNAFLNQKQWDNAIKAYHDCLEVNPNFSEAYYNLGVALYHLERWEEAFKFHQKLTELQPNFWECNQVDFQIQHKFGDLFFEEQRWEEAVVAYQRAIESNPNSHWSYNNLGRALQNLGKFEAGINSIRQAIEINPNFGAAYCFLADILLNHGELEQAIHHYHKALEINPDLSLDSPKLYEVLVQQGSVTEIEAFLQVQPTNTNLYRALAKVQEAEGDFLGQIESYQKLISIEPDQEISIYMSLADAFKQVNRYKEAIDIYQKALKLHPDFWLIFYYLGEIFHDTEDWKSAADHLEKAASLQPIFLKVYILLGNALANLGQIHEAIQAYEKANEINPKPDLLLKIEQLSQNLSQFDTNHQKVLSLSKEEIIFAELDDSEFFKQMFQSLLGRQPSSSELSLFLENYKNGFSTRASTLEQIIKSQEFLANSNNNQDELFPDMSNEEFIEYLYQTFLKRPAETEGVVGNCNALEQGIARSKILESFLKSEEFLSLEKQSFVEGISNHQFLHTIWEILLNGPCDSHSEKHYLNCLENGLSRRGLVLEIIKTDVFQKRLELFDSIEKNKLNPIQSNGLKNSASILGTGKFIDQDEWNDILLSVLLKQTSINNSYIDFNHKKYVDYTNDKKTNNFKHHIKNKALPIASIITSLYKG